jgi:cellulose synthase/poly-beta-1,6-N-acetylglucosamine synthase-like glycosyltransferase
MLAGLIFAVYTLSVLCVFVYAIGYYHLLYGYWATRNNVRPTVAPRAAREWPTVTIQLPLYNEQYVAAEVIDACAALEYPRDKFDIQVLDDSTDETVQIVDDRCAHWRQKGVDVNAVRRATRSGFKAGALAEATPKAKGRFIALFDADFRPKADFLEQLIPEFDDAKVAAVQARWGHLNREYSILTVAQSLLHDAFFVVEQEARARNGYCIRFNGSAGIWRRAAIADAGGWSADTLCEDMDLAYRVQLKGWRMVYRRDVVAPAELPVTIADYHTQQHRWHKGRTQVVRKLVGLTWRAQLPPIKKAHALFDQLNAVVVPGVLLLALGGPWFYMAAQGSPWMQGPAKWFALANINVLLLPAFAFIAVKEYALSVPARVMEVARTVPALVLLFLGMNFSLTVALLQGLMDSKAEFRRTAKYRVDAASSGQAWRGSAYAPRRDLAITIGSLALSVLFAGYVIFDLSIGSWSMTVFHSAMALAGALVGTRALVRA